MSDRTIIVGGGIIGMMTARELHAAGHDVTLIERQALAKSQAGPVVASCRRYFLGVISTASPD